MKLKYIGFRTKGKQVFTDGGELYVELNKVYDIPDRHVEGLIAGKCWEKVKEKKVKKVIENIEVETRGDD